MKFFFVESMWFWDLAMGSTEIRGGQIDQTSVERAAQENEVDPVLLQKCVSAGHLAVMQALLRLGLNSEKPLSAQLLLPQQLLNAKLTSPAEALELFERAVQKFGASPEIEELRHKLTTSAPA
jgi:hypothetical protein